MAAAAVAAPPVVPLIAYEEEKPVVPTEPTSITFDQHGDLQLHVGHNDKDAAAMVFTTCSRTLGRVSPVFERMLFGNFLESNPKAQGDSSDDWIVKLPEDKPAPLALFLSIAHGHFNKVPKNLTLGEFYELTVLTNYYDSTRALGPWVQLWMEAVEREARKTTLSMARSLWICWELGRETSFVKIAHMMLMDSKESLTETEMDTLQMPGDVVETIESIRISTIKSLLDIFRKLTDDLTVVDEKPRICRHAVWMGPHRCESMILGSITFCLTRAGLWPLPEPEEVEESISSLHRILTTLVVHDIGRQSDQKGIDHSQCNPNSYLRAEVERVIRGIADPVSDLHRTQLRRQSKRMRE